MSVQICRIILLTGDPGIGKTTLIKKLSNRLKQDGYADKIKGFYTEELRNEKHFRIGFDVIDINDESKREPLARTSEQSIDGPKVGKYTVDVKSFERLAIPLINSENKNSIYIIDEIGKMESFSKQFEKSRSQLVLENGNGIILATVPNKSTLDLATKVKSNPSSKLFTITYQNRNSIFDEIYNSILNLYKKINH